MSKDNKGSILFKNKFGLTQNNTHKLFDNKQGRHINTVKYGNVVHTTIGLQVDYL